MATPDTFQAIMNDIMGDLPNVRAYVDDILVTMAGSFEDHLKHIELVLQHLTDAGFAVNLRKSSFGLPVAVFNLNLRKWKQLCG